VEAISIIKYYVCFVLGLILHPVREMCGSVLNRNVCRCSIADMYMASDI